MQHRCVKKLCYARDEQLDFVHTFDLLAAQQFEARIRIYSLNNTRALTRMAPARQSRRQKATA